MNYTVELFLYVICWSHAFNQLFVYYTINNSLQYGQDCNDIFQKYKTNQKVRLLFVLILCLSTCQQLLGLYDTDQGVFLWEVSFGGFCCSLVSPVLPFDKANILL